MRGRILTLICILLGLALFPGFSLAGDGLGPDNAWPWEKSDLPPDPALVYGRLDNGFRYVLMHNREPKNRVAMLLDVRAGSLFDPSGKEGTSHFLEHAVFNGSTHFAPGELVKYFQSIGMRFGPDVNAYTGFDATVYNLLVPDPGPETLDKALMVMSDYAAGALFLEKEITRERGVVLAEKQARDSADYRTYCAAMHFALPGTFAASRNPIGEEKAIRSMGKSVFTDFYGTWYRPDNMVLVAVGDMDPRAAEPLVRKWFASLAPQKPAQPRPDPGKVRHQGDAFFTHYEKDAGATEVGIQVVYNVPAEPGTYSREKQLLLEDMAVEALQNRLDAMKDRPGCPFTSVDADANIFLSTIAFASVSATCDPENWPRSLSAVENVLRSALAYGFTESETARVKKNFRMDLENSALEADTRDSMDLAYDIVSLVNDGRVVLSPRQDLEIFGPVVDAVTAKDLHRAFLSLWPSDHRLVSVTGNARVPGKEKALEAAYRAALALPIEKPAEEKQAVFPYFTPPSAPGKIRARETLADTGVTSVVFENNVRLCLKPTDFKKNQVLATLRFGWGRSSEPPELPGLSGLSESVINESGVGPLTRDALEKALAGKATVTGFEVEQDCFAFQAESVTAELELLFNLLYAHVTDPSFRQDALDLSIERISQQYQSLSRSVDGAMAMGGLRFLAGGDSRFGYPDPDILKKMSLEDVRAWAGAAMRESPLEISLVGDLDVEKAIALCARTLGALPARTGPDEPPATRGIVFPAGKDIVIRMPTTVEKGQVAVAFPSADLWDIRRTRRLSVLAEVFSDRLREIIREKMGATYSPDAENMPSRAYTGYGVLAASVTVDPGKARKVAVEVKKIAADLAAKGVDPDEMHRALAPIVTGIKDQVRTNDYWLDSVLSGSSRHPEQMDWSRTILSDYESITREEVSALAKTYLDENKAAVVLGLPR